MIKLLDWEELEERIELYKGESSEWDSSHAYISARTLDCIGPNPVCHIDDG